MKRFSPSMLTRPLMHSQFIELRDESIGLLMLSHVQTLGKYRYAIRTNIISFAAIIRGQQKL
jgi:hypothetical protein